MVRSHAFQAPPVTLDKYKASVDAFKASFCADKSIIPDDTSITEDMEAEVESELTRSFWKIVRTECEPLVVPYGAGERPLLSVCAVSPARAA